MTREELDKALKIISRAWGREKGYCFFPWIDREAQEKAGMRRAGFHDGPGFHWPKDREKILKHMEEHQHHDLYWCPSLFEYAERKQEFAIEEHALWADLDEADPRKIDDYPPTIAWETSPNRYQALWIIGQDDMLGASWPGRENQQLTYHLGADLSGWDTVQLLRIPGWVNHKPDYRDEKGKLPKGKLLWDKGRVYLKDEFDELPEVEGAFEANQLTSVLTREIEAIDRQEVIGRVKLRLNHTARELLGARQVSGDRSGNLWYLTRSLADQGCTVQEIVAVVRETVWNKFEGRSNEIQTLISEATKAIFKRSDEVQEQLEEEANRPKVMRMADAFRDLKDPVWIIKDILTEGAVGFIAGQPKSFKSWCGLDMALSVAQGVPFLDAFQVVKKGPVLYIQEEDPAITLRNRANKIWKGKQSPLVSAEGDEVFWEPSHLGNTKFDPDIAVYIKQGVTISEPSWQEWIKDTLEEGFGGQPYVLMVIDTLMRTAGPVDENRAVEMMTKIFRPLSTIADVSGVAIQVVHHMRKGKNENGERGGQLMLGSVANHAWAEDSIYLSHTATGDIAMDFESKTAPGARYRISNIVKSKVWEPHVTPEIVSTSESITQPKSERRVSNKADHARRRAHERGQTGWSVKDRLPGLLHTSEGRTIQSLATQLGITRSSARNRLMKAEQKGLVTKGPDMKWRLAK